jgi:hypothetical protein
MRTRSDLETVFAVLERQVDELLNQRQFAEPSEAIPESRPASFDVLPATATVVRRPAPRRRALALLATAAMVAAVALGAVQVFGGFGSGAANSGGIGASSDGLGVTSLAFSIKPSAGQVIAVRVIPGTNVGQTVGHRVQEADVFNSDGLYRVHVSGKGVALGVSIGGTTTVDVNGRIGHYGCLDGRHWPTDFANCGGGKLAWQYAPSAWAQVWGYKATETNLLRLARAVDFAHPMQLRTPISLRTAPPGLTLADAEVDYQSDDANGPQDKPDPAGWGFVIDYGPDNSSSHVLFNVGPGNVGKFNQTGQPVTIDGRSAWWYTAIRHTGDTPSHELYLDAAHNVQILIAMPASWTLSQARSLAAGITVTAHPDQPDTWPTMSQALP